MRILLIEDEPKVARFIMLGLKAEGWAVDVASQGDTGLDLALANSYDLLVVDLMLPHLSGTELIRQLRKEKPDVPILVLTARSALNDKIATFENGADDYLTKPFAFAELLVRAKALLRRGAVNRANVICVGDLEVDRLAHRVRRQATLLNFTSKEYALLEYLAVNAGRVLSRTMILEHVWDESFESLTNIVDVYVRQLRLKVDEPYAEKLIHTVRGVGYMMQASSSG